MCETYGVKASAIQADVAKNEDVQALVAKEKEEYGSIDILVNNAGITKDNLMLKMTEEDFEQVIDTNLKGAFLCIKHVSKIMLKQKRGHIINISSVVGVRGNAGQVKFSDQLRQGIDPEQLTDVIDQVDFIDSLPEYDNAMYCHKKMKTTEESALQALRMVLPVLEALPEWTESAIHDALIWPLVLFWLAPARAVLPPML